MKRKALLFLAVLACGLMLCACSGGKDGSVTGENLSDADGGAGADREEDMTAEPEGGAGEQAASGVVGQESQAGVEEASDAPADSGYEIEQRLKDAEEEAKRLAEGLRENVSVEAREEAAEACYKLWDQELNDLWTALKGTLEEAEMSALTEEEREWIGQKETAAGEVADFSIDADFIFWSDAMFTRLRVYELAELLGEKTGQSAPAPHSDAYTGFYVDKQGTEDIYSELFLLPVADGVYAASIGIYRLTGLSGIAWADGESLAFTGDDPVVKGKITVQNGGAEFTVTDSEFTYLQRDDMFAFPEKEDWR